MEVQNNAHSLHTSGCRRAGCPGLRPISANLGRISSGWPTTADSIKGCKQLAQGAVYWETLSSGIGGFLAKGGQKGW
jgi:hypothetical protein